MNFTKLLAAIFVVALMTACEVGVRAKVDSRPSPEATQQSHPNTTGDVTTDLTHGEDGCDYALARNGQVTKIPGSCPSDMQGGAR